MSMNNQAFLISQWTSVSLLTCGLSNLMWYVQLRTESWWGTFEDSNIWQSIIFAPKDEWFEVMVMVVSQSVGLILHYSYRSIFFSFLWSLFPDPYGSVSPNHERENHWDKAWNEPISDLWHVIGFICEWRTRRCHFRTRTISTGVGLDQSIASC